MISRSRHVVVTHRRYPDSVAPVCRVAGGLRFNSSRLHYLAQIGLLVLLLICLTFEIFVYVIGG